MFWWTVQFGGCLRGTKCDDSRLGSVAPWVSALVPLPKGDRGGQGHFSGCHMVSFSGYPRGVFDRGPPGDGFGRFEREMIKFRDQVMVRCEAQRGQSGCGGEGAFVEVLRAFWAAEVARGR